MSSERFGDFLVRFLSVSQMMDKATTPRVSSRFAPAPAGAIEEARRHMFELRGEARQLIIRLNEETCAKAGDDRLPPLALKARLDIALGLFNEGGLNRFVEWADAASLSRRAAELQLIEAILQVVSENDEFTAASALLARTFHDRLAEARDGLV